MAIRENPYPVKDLIVPRHVLVSVFDKTGLPELVEGLLRYNPDVRFYSTGGTGKKILETLGEERAGNYTSIEDFTLFPEMDGGLVKTLSQKIYAGLLGERGNPLHEQYLREVMMDRTGSEGVYIDVMVGNLYPFEQVISQDDATAELARVNIDIGGPAMVRAAAKNFHSVAVLTHAHQYPAFLVNINVDGGTTLAQRLEFSQAAWNRIEAYDRAINGYFRDVTIEEALKGIKLVSGDEPMRGE